MRGAAELAPFAMSLVLAHAAVAAGGGEGAIPDVPSVYLDIPKVSGGDLTVQPPARYAPVVGADGETLVGPDGRDRCVVIAPPPAAIAAAPMPGPALTADDPAPYDDVQRLLAAGGESVAVSDRPLTLAETVPCP